MKNPNSPVTGFDLHESQRSFDLYSRIDETKGGVRDILAQDVPKLMKLLGCGIFFKRSDFVIRAINLLGDDLDTQEFSMKYRKNILSFFMFLTKGRKRITPDSESGFSWFMEMQCLRAVYVAFGKHIDLEPRLRSLFHEMITSIRLYRYSKEIIESFPEIDFSEEIKKGFHYYISKTSVNYLDNALLLYKDHSGRIDFSDDIANNIVPILGYFRRSCAIQDMDRIGAMIRLLGDKVDFEQMSKRFFVALLDKSYNKAFDFWKYVKDYDIANEVKEGFIIRLKRNDLRFAKQIIKDFGGGMEFTPAIKIGIAHLRAGGMLVDEIKMMEYFSI